MYYLNFDAYKDFDLTHGVLKSFNVDELLSDTNMSWFDNSVTLPPYFKEGDKSLYYPIDFAISIRSLYSNLVLCKKGSCYVVKQSRDMKLPHRGLDLVMYEASKCVFSFLDTIKLDMSVVSDIMMHSIFQLVGFYATYNCPMFYSHVILKDDEVSRLEKYLLNDCKFVPIEQVKPDYKNPVVLTDTLILVKEKSENEE